jgi:hypothetical protein
MKKLLLLSACLFTLASHPVQAQSGQSPIVLVRISEGGSYGNKLVIFRSEISSEEYELSTPFYGQTLRGASEVVYREFNKLYQQGYKLRSSSGGEGVTSTFVFTKEQ